MSTNTTPVSNIVHNSYGNHTTEYAACEACFDYALLLDGYCLSCDQLLRKDW